MKKVALTLAIAFASYLTVNAQSTNTSTSGSSQTQTEQQSTDVQSSQQNSQDQQGMGAAAGSETELRGEAASQLEELPAAVRSSFMASDHADMEVTKVEREGENYIIEGKKEEKEVKLEYDAQGQLVDKKKKQD